MISSGCNDWQFSNGWVASGHMSNHWKTAFSFWGTADDDEWLMMVVINDLTLPYLFLCTPKSREVWWTVPSCKHHLFDPMSWWMSKSDCLSHQQLFLGPSWAISGECSVQSCIVQCLMRPPVADHWSITHSALEHRQREAFKSVHVLAY